MTDLDVRPRTEPCEDACQGVHSYVADGRRVCWRPATPGRHSVDAEIADQPIPEALRGAQGTGRLSPSKPLRQAQGAGPRGTQDFWRAWTRAEALAKLTDTPIALWLRRHGLDAPTPDGVRLEHHALGDLVVCTAEADA